MNCIRCDAVIPDRSKFCPKCGAVQIQDLPAPLSEVPEASGKPDAFPAAPPEPDALIPAAGGEQASASSPEASGQEDAAAAWTEEVLPETEPDWEEPEGYEADPLQFEPDPAPNQPEEDPVPPQIGQAERKSGKLMTLLFGIGVLAVVAAAVLILLLFLSKQQDKRPTRPSGQNVPTAPVPTESTASADPGDTEDSLASEYAPGEPDPEVDCAGEYALTLWVPAAERELYGTLIQRFNEENTDGIVIHPTLVSVEPDQTADKLVQAPEDGADLLCLNADGLEALVRRGLLSPLPASSAVAVRTRNDSLSLSLAAVSSRLYAYPLSCDGPVIYYDNTVIPASALGSLDAILQACAEQEKLLSFSLGAGDTLAAFYLASGVSCSSTWTVNEEGAYVGYSDDLESDRGVLALRGLRQLLNAPQFRSVTGVETLDHGTAVLAASASVGGSVRAILGERFGVAPLPAFGVDGIAHSMGAYTDGTLLAVADRTDYDPAVGATLHKLAAYLTDEAAQTARHETLGLCPTNRAALETARREDPVVEALLGHRSETFRRGPVPTGWEEAARKLLNGTKALSEEEGEEALMELLRRYTDQLRSIVMNDATLTDFTAMGTIGETYWNKDYPLYEIRPGYCVSQILFLKEGEECKVRQGGSWDRNYGVDGRDGKNCVVETDGWYCVWFDENSGLMGLEARPEPAS